VYPLIVAGKRLGKNVTAATNTHATIGELLEASFSMRSVSYQRKGGQHFFPELLSVSSVGDACYANSILLDLVILTAQNEKHKLQIDGYVHIFLYSIARSAFLI
jgi:hypothetical protein